MPLNEPPKVGRADETTLRKCSMRRSTKRSINTRESDPFVKVRALYGHGFASDRNSQKAIAIEAWLAEKGIACERLNLRDQDDSASVNQNKYTSANRQMRLSAMIDL